MGSRNWNGAPGEGTATAPDWEGGSVAGFDLAGLVVGRDFGDGSVFGLSCLGSAAGGYLELTTAVAVLLGGSQRDLR